MSQSEMAREALVRRIRRVTFALFLCSGISSLIFEIVWVRLLTVILGNTVFAVSTVLTVFMGGMALGSFLAGRIIDRRNDPLRVYAILEIAIGVLGLLLTTLLNQSGSVYVWIHGALGGHPVLLYAARYLFAFCLLAVPTTLMGATLPVLSKFTVDRQSVVGVNIGRLYALNTFGAAFGTYLAGFWLIGGIGVRLTVGVAALVSVCVGFLAWHYQKRVAEIAGKDEGSLPTPEPVDAGVAGLPADGARPAAFRLLIPFAFMVSGFASLGYEVIWTRVLIFFLSNTVYAFSTMLTVYLIGIGFGSLVVSKFVDRWKHVVAGLGVIQLGIGLFVLGTVYVFGWFGRALAPLGDHYPMWQDTAIRFGKAFALLLVPTFLCGATFPVVGRIHTVNFHRIGRSIGELYTWNTIGSIAGSAVTGFVLMPALGLQTGLILLCCLNVGMGILLCAVEPGFSPVRRWVTVLVLVGIVGGGFVGMPRQVFRRMQEVTWSSGELVFYEEDPISTVSVRRRGSELSILMDNIDVAGTAPIYMDSHKSLGHLPMLLHPNPEKVFVLGFGAGGASYAISTYPEVVRIDAAELCGAVAEAAKLLPMVNHNVYADERFHMHINDGRHFLLTSEETYDVISVDLLLAGCAGAGSLYTREFYELCYERLSEDGVMVQWISPSHIPFPYTKMILRTACDVFPHASLWLARHHNHVILAVSKSPFQVDFKRLIERMGTPAVQRDLEEVHLGDPYSFLSYFVGADDALVPLLEEAGPLNTDDHPLVEYGLPSFSPEQLLGNLSGFAPIKTSILPILTGMEPYHVERMRKYEEASRLMLGSIIAHKMGEQAKALSLCEQAVQVASQYYEAVAWLAYYQRQGEAE